MIPLRWKSILLLLFFLSGTCEYTAAESRTRLSFSGFPQASYSEETGIIGGAIGFLRFWKMNKPEHLPRNSLMLTARYSQKKQFTSRFESEIHFREGIYRSLTKFQYENWPSTFYGIGNDNRESSGEDYTPEITNLELSFFRKLNPSWSLGIDYEFARFILLDSEEEGTIAAHRYPGCCNNITSGLGLIFICDSRDNRNYPFRGKYHQIKLTRFAKSLGSDFNFTRYSIDLRYYYTLAAHQVLALQGVLTVNKNLVPFHKMPRLDDYLRAVTTDLFLDRDLTILRIEYRYFPWTRKFLNRLGMVLFLETGQVADHLAQFGFDRFKISYGLGFRFSLFTDEIFNLRFDIGFSPQHTNYVASGGEAF
ncbi:MAG: BamA/TamA family outer membrane protein [Candidatus Cloacimonetes bacterium]|nr:BamA/TamA family outer membrane protein [Candidatus Cloacimonadota bacterium]